MMSEEIIVGSPEWEKEVLEICEEIKNYNH